MIGLAIRLVREPALMQASMNTSFFISDMCLEIVFAIFTPHYHRIGELIQSSNISTFKKSDANYKAVNNMTSPLIPMYAYTT